MSGCGEFFFYLLHSNLLFVKKKVLRVLITSACCVCVVITAGGFSLLHADADKYIGQQPDSAGGCQLEHLMLMTAHTNTASSPRGKNMKILF